MTSVSKAFFKRFECTSKCDLLMDEKQIIHVNLNYAQVLYSNGQEIIVLLQNLALCPQKDTVDNDLDYPLTPTSEKELSKDIKRYEASKHDFD